MVTFYLLFLEVVEGNYIILGLDLSKWLKLLADSVYHRQNVFVMVQTHSPVPPGNNLSQVPLHPTVTHQSFEPGIDFFFRRKLCDSVIVITYLVICIDFMISGLCWLDRLYWLISWLLVYDFLFLLQCTWCAPERTITFVLFFCCVVLMGWLCVPFRKIWLWTFISSWIQLGKIGL